jgi:acetylornithine/succinyldiaminopimelate/putrescine aminotransferase
MIGIELGGREEIPAFTGSDKPAAIQLVNQLHGAGLLTVPAGTQIVRLLPALNLTRAEAEQGLQIIESTVASLAAR